MSYRCSNLSKHSDSSGSETTSPTFLADDTQYPPSPREILPVYAKNFTLNSTSLELPTTVRQESCPSSHTPSQVKTRGRPTNAETFSKVRSQSTSSIRNYLCVSNSKRYREEDPLTSSPSSKPLKISRTHSSPSDPSSLLVSGDAGSWDSMESILEKLEEMRTESSQQFSSLKNELINKIETSRQDTIKEFQSVIDNLRQENTKLQDSVGALEARVATLESSTGATNLNNPSQSLHKKIASASSNALEKHLRRNKIVVRGLPVSASNARDSLNKFIHSNFGITNSFIDATLFGKNNETIKATLCDALLKPINEDFMLDNLSLPIWLRRHKTIVEKFRTFRKNLDMQRYAQSSSLQFPHSNHYSPARLLLICPHRLAKPKIQLRLASVFVYNITLKGII
ncbi:hypothetical protein KQX54_009076 [Cotesia glomerata]|uniref:Uncharacterized protein n=1 Tax=Cotesia glomerata TaxID=32391 RepID=A0AAV7ICB3_COTGL|nr:hypothetical protein KQX54_009076 [Cotesia glomerata]